MSLGKGLHLQVLNPLWPQAVAEMTLPWPPVHLKWTKKEELCPWQCIIYHAAFLTSKEMNSGHSPICSTKSPGLVHTPAWPLCHGSLEFPVKTKTEPSTLTLAEMKRQEGTESLSSPPSWNILRRVSLLFMDQSKWLLKATVLGQCLLAEQA